MTKKTAQMKLLQPFKLGQMELKNRIVMAPMVMNYATSEGYVSDRMKAYYEARAKGGPGLILMEAASIDFSRNKCYVRQLCIDDDKFIPRLKGLVDTIHKYDARVALQLHHGGSFSRRDLTPLPPVSSSAVGSKDAYIQYSERKDLPQELTPADIAGVVQLYAKAAGRAEKAGFDSVEVHAAHGYLIGQFLSAARNKRTDAYGGELPDRARFLLEILAAVREVVGADYPVWCKLSAEETGMAGGITFAETRELVRILERDGKLNAIHISGVPPARTFYTPAGYFVDFASEIKKVTALPVIVAGAINIELAEKILGENKADLIAIARAFLADPEWPGKLVAGRTDDIRPCLRDSSCRDCLAYKDTPVTCTVNAALGRETEFAIRPAKKAKRVVVVGGGPAGLEAARVLAERGHKVTLIEKGGTLGGQLLLAAMPPNKELVERYRSYLIKQFLKLGIEFEVNKEATVSTIKKIGPDAVIIATGSTPVSPQIPGMERKIVLTAEAVLSGKARTGKNVVIIGGGTTGCETAHYLARMSKKVTIIEMLDAVMKNMMPSAVGGALLDVLAKSGVNIMTSTRVEEITDAGLIVSRQGKKEAISADSVVVTAGRRSNTELVKALNGLVPEVYVIGDAVQPGLITNAIDMAFRTALAI